MELPLLSITGVPEFDVFFSLVWFIGVSALVPSAILTMVRRG